MDRVRLLPNHIQSILVKDIINTGSRDFCDLGLIFCFRDEERIENVLQSCAGQAHKKKQLVFGGDTQGRCLTKEMAEKTIELGGFEISCAPTLGAYNQFYVYKFYQ